MASRRLLGGLLALSVALGAAGGLQLAVRTGATGSTPIATAAAGGAIGDDHERRPTPPTPPTTAPSTTEPPAELLPPVLVPPSVPPTTVAPSAERPRPAGTTTVRAPQPQTARTPAAPAPVRTSPPTTAPAPAADYAFMRTNPDGTPVRYDASRPIRFRTRLAGGPSFARSELSWAIAQIEAASGLDFQWAGDVTASVTAGWDRTGPVYIGFETTAEFAMPATASGYADSWTVDDGGGFRHYVGGRLVLRPDHGWTSGTTSTNPLGLMFLHELGHLVGLAHVDSPHEVMTDRGNGTARRLGPGDRIGLAAVGRPL